MRGTPTVIEIPAKRYAHSGAVFGKDKEPADELNENAKYCASVREAMSV